MEKVKLPKEVAEAIDRVWFAVQDDLAAKHMRLINWNFLHEEVGQYQVIPSDLKTLMEYAEAHPLEYMQALVNGYEVEQTPEDKVLDYYEKLFFAGLVCEAESVISTLNLLGIQIKGVNAE